jgi:hypothetical protein
VEGSIQFDQDPMVHTVYGGEGDGTAEVTENYGGCNVQQHEHKNGAVHITLSGHGSARDAVLKVSFIGDNLTWMYTCAGGCNNNYHESGPRGYGDGCEINNVDLVRGGTFSGPGTQPNYATCTVTIPGQ